MMQTSRLSHLRILTVGTILTFSSLQPTLSQSWSALGPSAKSIRCISQPQGSSTTYAGAFGWGVFKTTDAGNTWANFKTGMTNTYVRSLFALSENVVFAGTNDGVFKSTNGGALWEISLATLNSVRSMAYDPSTGALYAATYGQGLYKTSDLGTTWISLAVTDPVSSETLSHLRAVAVFGRDSLYAGGSILDIGSGGALFQSVDGGVSWIQVQRSIGIRSSVMSISVSPSNPATWLIIGTAVKGVYQSQNAGTNWADVNASTLPVPLPDLNISSVLLTATQYFASTDSAGVVYYRSVTDTTAGWAAATGLPGQVAVANYLSVDRMVAGALWLGTEGSGVYRSTTSGISWSSRNTGMMGVDARDVRVAPNGNLILGTGFGDNIWRSTDSGSHWIRSLAYGTANSVMSVATTAQASVVFVAVYGSGVYKSIDGGNAWTITDSTVMNHFVRQVVAHPTDANVAYAGTGNGVYKSTNGGISWFGSSTGIPALTSIRSMEIHPLNPAVLFAGSDLSYLFRSTNAGSSWTNVTNSSGFLTQDQFIRTISVDSANPSLVYIGADSGRIYRSTDLGVTWSLRAQLPTVNSVRKIVINPHNDSILFAGTFGAGIFVSVNQGLQWVTFNSGLPDLEISSLSSDVSDPLRLYAGTANSGVFVREYSFTNQPPVLASIGSRLFPAGQVSSIMIAASDPDGPIPALSATGVPPGASFVDSLNGHGLFSWNPALSDTGVTFVTFHAADASSADSEKVTVTVVDPSSTAIVTMEEREGWNLVSVGVKVADGAKSTLFPAAVSSAYGYWGGYQSHDTLVQGLGYWLKFQNPQTVQIAGQPIVADTVEVGSRWNIIGGLSFPLPTSKIVAVPPTTIVSPVYGFSGTGYSAVDTLRPGEGYWIKVSTGGQLILDIASPSSLYSVVERADEERSYLVATDASGARRSLWLPGSVDQQSLAMLDLPPAPPGSELDIRFDLSSMIDESESHVHKISIPLRISGAHYPVDLMWHGVRSSSPARIIVTDHLRRMAERDLLVGGRTLLQVEESVLLQIGGMTESNRYNAPINFSLPQNYPNPFNPQTMIDVYLPAAAHVTLVVFNVAGQMVASLADAEFTEGFHKFTWNAGSMPSGVYYCVVAATDPSTGRKLFGDTREMILAK